MPCDDIKLKLEDGERKLASLPGWKRPYQAYKNKQRRKKLDACLAAAGLQVTARRPAHVPQVFVNVPLTEKDELDPTGRTHAARAAIKQQQQAELDWAKKEQDLYNQAYYY
jgi:hypothetical protein